METAQPTQSGRIRQKSLFFGVLCIVLMFALIVLFYGSGYFLSATLSTENRVPEPSQMEAGGQHVHTSSSGDSGDQKKILSPTSASIAPSKKSVSVSGTTAAVPTPPLAQKGSFGISVARTFEGFRQDELNRSLDDIVSLGLSRIRIDMDWGEIQSHDSAHYEWAGIDRVVAAAERRHIDVLAILVYTPHWARPADCNSNRCPPADPAEFANFAAVAVRRFAPAGVHEWEIWNEPNLRKSWVPAADAGAYATLLKATYTSIKREDSSAVVVSGGLGPSDTKAGNISPRDYLTALYEDGAAAYFDAFGFHPYSFPVTATYQAPWSAWQQMAGTNPSLRSIMIAHGDASKKIWMTEYGAPTGGPGAATDKYTPGEDADHVTEALQTKMAANAIKDLQSDPWAGPLFWYSYRDLGTSRDTIENFFGILRFDGSQKPVYQELLTELSSNTVH